MEDNGRFQGHDTWQHRWGPASSASSSGIDEPLLPQHAGQELHESAGTSMFSPRERTAHDSESGAPEHTDAGPGWQFLPHGAQGQALPYPDDTSLRETPSMDDHPVRAPSLWPASPDIGQESQSGAATWQGDQGRGGAHPAGGLLSAPDAQGWGMPWLGTGVGARGLDGEPLAQAGVTTSRVRRVNLSAAEMQALAGVPPLAVKKKKMLGQRSWIVITAQGECQKLEADKGTIMRRCDLPGRDLRLLDPVFVYPSTILGREKAIVVNLESVRCIITADEVLLLHTADPAVQEFKGNLLRRLLTGSSAAPMGSSVGLQAPSFPGTQSPAKMRDEAVMGMGFALEDDDLPFEFKALEVALDMATSTLDSQAKKLVGEAMPTLDQLTAQISTATLEKVRRLKSRLLSLTGRVQKVRAEIEQLMDDDGDMAEMYLTEKRMRAEASAHFALRHSSGHFSHFPHAGSVAGSRRGAAAALAAAGQGVVKPTSTDSLGGFGSVCQSAPISPVGSPSLRGFTRATSKRVMHDTSIRSSERSPSLHDGDGEVHLESASESLSLSSVSPSVENVETLEMLLEAYFVVVDSTLNKLTELSQYIDDTEDFINIQLDNVRNQLIQFELVMTTAAFVVALWGVVAGIFGMNVPLGVEEDNSALRKILVDSGCGGVLVFVAFLVYFRYKNWTM